MHGRNFRPGVELGPPSRGSVCQPMPGRGSGPLHRFGEVAEIGKAALFLASDDSSFMTGSELVVEGGISQL